MVSFHARVKKTEIEADLGGIAGDVPEGVEDTTCQMRSARLVTSRRRVRTDDPCYTRSSSEVRILEARQEQSVATVRYGVCKS